MSVPAIPSGPYAPVTLIGGYGGSAFSTYGWDQGWQVKTVSLLDVWYSSSYLRGIQVTFSDHTQSSIIGSAEESHATFNFTSQGPITSMTLWGNGVGTRTGRIRITTSKSTYDVGKNTSGQTAYPVNVGAGVLMGMVGRSGADIDMLGALFLRSPIANIAITNVVYTPSLAGTTTGIGPVAINTATYSNPANSTQTLHWNFGGAAERSATKTFSQSAEKMSGQSISIEVSAGSFGIGVSASSGFEWQTTNTTTTETSVSTELDFSWGLDGELNPGQSCHLAAIVYSGSANVTYTSIVAVSLVDGTTNVYRENGVLTDVAYTDVMVQITQGNSVKLMQKGIEIDKELLRGFVPPSE